MPREQNVIFAGLPLEHDSYSMIQLRDYFEEQLKGLLPHLPPDPPRLSRREGCFGVQLTNYGKPVGCRVASLQQAV